MVDVCAGVAGDAEVTETDLAEELPLCCCRMETPHSGGSLSTLDQMCMAMESTDGMVKMIWIDKNTLHLDFSFLCLWINNKKKVLTVEHFSYHGAELTWWTTLQMWKWPSTLHHREQAVRFSVKLLFKALYLGGFGFKVTWRKGYNQFRICLTCFAQ